MAAEIWLGLSRLEADSRRRLLTNEYRRSRAVLRWADWSEPASSLFGQWKAALQRRGTPIEDMDLAIASIALSLPVRLATCNIRHFARIDDLKLVDWSEPKDSCVVRLRPQTDPSIESACLAATSEARRPSAHWPPPTTSCRLRSRTWRLLACPVDECELPPPSGKSLDRFARAGQTAQDTVGRDLDVDVSTDSRLCTALITRRA